MAAIATISLKNYAAVEQTYNPVLQRSDLVGWDEAGASSLAATRKATIGLKIPKDLSSGTAKVTFKLTYPVVDGTTGALLRTPLCWAECTFPASASQTERRETFARFKDLLADAVAQATIDDLALPY